MSREASLHQLTVLIKKGEKEKEVLSKKLEKLENQVKKLVRDKNKKKAKQVLQEVKMRRDQFNKKTNQTMFFIKTKI